MRSPKRNWICNIGMPSAKPYQGPVYPDWHWRPRWSLRKRIEALRDKQQLCESTAAPTFTFTFDDGIFTLDGEDYRNLVCFQRVHRIFSMGESGTSANAIYSDFRIDGIDQTSQPKMDRKYYDALLADLEEMEATACTPKDIEAIDARKEFLSINTFSGSSSSFSSEITRQVRAIRKSIVLFRLKVSARGQTHIADHVDKHIHVVRGECWYDGNWVWLL